VWGWVVFGVVLLSCVSCLVGTFLFVRVVDTASKITAEDITHTFQSFGPSMSASFFYSSLESGGYYLAREQLSSEMAGQWTATDLRDMWEALGEGGLIEYEVQDATMDGNLGTAQVRLKTNRGLIYLVYLDFENRDGLWLITGASPDLIPSP
jgi:hypothetical protein